VERLVISEGLVRRLVATQFPQWADLPIRSISHGWDNRTFRLGHERLVRLPSATEYATQVEKEQYWLPRLAPSLTLPIPTPLAIGAPTSEYPWRWSIYGWIEGEIAVPEHVDDMAELATSLAAFLTALHRIDAAKGPPPGAHNFYRGASVATYDAETRHAIHILGDRIDTHLATEVWETALATSWVLPPVWVHGDISPENLLVERGKLSAVIDFGALAVGDPACDLSIAWTSFQSESRRQFRRTLQLDSATWARGRAWTLWKALIVAAGLVRTNEVGMRWPFRVIEELLEAHKIDA
jgi:aminoglycoside phosphotransferase (APT) family kinase protein